MKIHKQIVDADGHIQIGKHGKTHCQEGVYKNSAFFSYHSENSIEGAKKEQILSKQKDPFLMPPEAANIVQPGADSQGVIFVADDEIRHVGETVIGQHILYNNGPMGEIVVMLQLDQFDN